MKKAMQLLNTITFYMKIIIVEMVSFSFKYIIPFHSKRIGYKTYIKCFNVFNYRYQFSLLLCSVLIFFRCLYEFNNNKIQRL